MAAHPDPVARTPRAPVLTLDAPVEHELIERKSRFLAALHPVRSVAEADAALRAIRSAHPGARHHCTALVLAEHIPGAGDPTGSAVTPALHRSSDDGEPSGTAGMPMLQSLLRADLVDVVAVVTRYFGGVKLGAGGLLRAYTAAVEEAIAAAGSAGLLRERVELEEWQIEVPLAESGIAENAVRRFAESAGPDGRAEVLPTSYSSTSAQLAVLLSPQLAAPFAADVAAWSQGRAMPVQGPSRSRDLPVIR